MTDTRLEINAAPRNIPPGRDLDTPILSLVWQKTQKWSEEIKHLKESQQAVVEQENEAWITLADEWFRLQKVYDALAPAMEHSEFSQYVKDLSLIVRRIKQILKSHKIEIMIPVGLIYSSEFSEIVESVDQVTQPDIKEPVIQEVLVPVIKRADQIIRFGKAIIAVPEESEVKMRSDTTTDLRK